MGQKIRLYWMTGRKRVWALAAVPLSQATEHTVLLLCEEWTAGMIFYYIID